jgi:hypothetical protein
MSDCDHTMCGDTDCADCYPRREVDRLRATVEALEQERDEARDCGQDGGCALSPGCQRHWMERNTELWRERDEALERLANVRAALRDTLRDTAAAAALRAGEPKP